MKRTVFFFLLLSVLLVSCASNGTYQGIPSYSDPNIKLYEYNKILIVDTFRDIAFQKALENGIISKLNSQGFSCISLISQINPLKDYSQEELEQIISNLNVDAILYVDIIDSETSTSPLVTTISTHTTISPYTGNVFTSSTSRTTGGKTLTTSLYEITIRDVQSGELVFRGTTKIGSSIFTKSSSVAIQLSSIIFNEFMGPKMDDLYNNLITTVISRNPDITYETSFFGEQLKIGSSIYSLKKEQTFIHIQFPKNTAITDDPRNITVRYEQKNNDQITFYYTVDFSEFSDIEYVCNLIEQAKPI